MLSDRDITTRAVARGLDPEPCKVKEVMSAEVFDVFDDESVEDVALDMGSAQVRRMPVVNRDKRLVGIVSLGDIAQSAGQARPAAEALEEISQVPPNASVTGTPRRRSDGKAGAG
ncbi:MAG TPA: CBS domain-containing protein [Burkholderiales bacterium]|nr:CBS domain-containing protein [Burkholderiales bacterium]